MIDDEMSAVDTAAVAKRQDPAERPVDGVDAELVGRLVEQARAAGLQLTGDGGLLQQLTKRVLESALEGEITDHLGYDRHNAAGRDSGNSRNGHRSKTVLTEVGPVEIDVPRDRAGSFEPKIVAKRKRRLSGVDEFEEVEHRQLIVLELDRKPSIGAEPQSSRRRGLRRRRSPRTRSKP